MSVQIIAQQVLILLLIMSIGFIGRKTGVLKKETNEYFANLMIYVTLPMLILKSFQFDVSKDLMNDAFLVFIITFCIFLFAIIFSAIAYKKFQPKRKVLFSFCTVFSNCAFMGFPVIESILGTTGVFLASFYILHFNVFLWTYGLTLYHGREKGAFKKVLLNPSIVAIFIGIIFLFAGIKLPKMLYDTASMVGAMTTPLAMMMVGSVIASIHIKEVFKGKDIYYVLFARLLFVPGIVLLVLKLIGLSPEVVAVCTLLTAMPIAANTAIFAEKYKGDIVFASKAVAISTIASIVTIPLFAFLILI